MAEYGMETTTIALQEKVHKLTIYRKTDAYSFLYSQGSVMEHYLERGTTITSGHFSEMLTSKQMSRTTDRTCVVAWQCPHC
jgi:hypothetical protein